MALRYCGRVPKTRGYMYMSRTVRALRDFAVARVAAALHRVGKQDVGLLGEEDGGADELLEVPVRPAHHAELPHRDV